MKQPEIIVSICQFCSRIYACNYSSETIDEKRYCATCNMQPNCNIAANYELFEKSHGICEIDMQYYYPETGKEVVHKGVDTL